MGIFRIVAALFRSIVVDRAELAAENLALRQQLAVLQQKLKRPRLRSRDRIFWALLSRIWANWRSALLIVQPDTVVGWHRQGFKLFWQWKSQRRRGRPRIEAEIRKLIRRMSRENPLWGTPRIQSELALLGRIVAESTVDQYRIIPRKPPSPTWRAFLDNHVRDIAAIDFFTVPHRDISHTFRLRHSSSRSAPCCSLQCHRSSDGGMDSAADRGGFSIRRSAALLDSRSGWNLRRRVSAARDELGRRTGHLSAPFALAESVLRTPCRFNPPRMPRPCHRDQRTASPPHPVLVLRLLPERAGALVLGPKLADRAKSRTDMPWSHRRDSAGRRLTSSLSPRRLSTPSPFAFPPCSMCPVCALAEKERRVLVGAVLRVGSARGPSLRNAGLPRLNQAG